MRRRIRKSVAAEHDLIEIWRYGYSEWGEAQADRYLDRFEAALDRLEMHPLIGTDCDDFFPGYRKLTVGRHLVFYRLTSDGIEVVRVLHAAVDVVRWLPGDDGE